MLKSILKLYVQVYYKTHEKKSNNSKNDKIKIPRWDMGVCLTTKNYF